MIRTTRILPFALAACAVLGAACVLPESGRAQDAPLATDSSAERDVARAVRDVEVMRRILSKEALGSQGSARSAFLVAESYYTNAWLNGGSAEGYFVEGQGAVFLLRTSDPVNAPKPSGDAAEAEPETLWERTVADVEGRPRRRDPRLLPAGAEYDAEKVRALEDRILEQLAKFGTQMSEIRRNEKIVVIVNGGAGTAHDLTLTAVRALHRATDANENVPRLERGGSGRTVRTICVLMRDVVDVARSNGGAAALRERATIRSF